MEIVCFSADVRQCSMAVRAVRVQHCFLFVFFLFIYFLPASIAGKLINRVMLLVGLGEWKLLNKCHTQYHRYRGATFKVGGGG